MPPGWHSRSSNVRTAVGAANVLLFDAGDEMQGSLLSNLQQGVPVIDYFNTIGYNAATFGNHEFDWGQTVLGDPHGRGQLPLPGGQRHPQGRRGQLHLDAVRRCRLAGLHAWGRRRTPVNVGVIGVELDRDPLHHHRRSDRRASASGTRTSRSLQHYAALDAASDVIVVLSHNGYTDGGYGYGFTVYGDQTLASKLNTAGKPVNLIIGGHSHTDLAVGHHGGQHRGGPGPLRRPQGRPGRHDLQPRHRGGHHRLVAHHRQHQRRRSTRPIQTLVNGYATDPAYLALINQPIGYTQIDLLRNYNGDNLMGDFVDDAIYGAPQRGR